MSTRKIKDAKDLSTNELIYFKGHAQATYMSDGRTVEEAVNSMSVGSGSSGANVQAVVREGYQEPEVRPLRDAVDLATGEKIYFAGDAKYICVDGNAMLLDYIDDKVAAARFIKWDIEAGSVDYVPDEVFDWIFTQQGILVLNGSVAVYVHNEDTDTTSIQSAFVKDDNIVVTKVFLTGLGYDSDLVTIDSYPISGGSGGSSSSGVTSVKINGQSKSPSSGVVDLGYINKQLSTSTSSSMTLSPNIYYRNTSTSLSTLTIKLGSVSNSNIINEYFVEFTTRSSGTTVTLPTGIKWANGETPTFEANTTYQISIVNNLGVVTKFK